MPLNLEIETYVEINPLLPSQQTQFNNLMKNRIFETYNLPLYSNSTNIETEKFDIEVISKIMETLYSHHVIYPERMVSYSQSIRPEFYSGVTEKVLTRFEGRVENIRGENINISLIDERTKETFIAECSIEEFERSNIRNIYEEMKFICEILERGGDTIVRLKPFKRLKLSSEEINKIRKEIKEDFNEPK